MEATSSPAPTLVNVNAIVKGASPSTARKYLLLLVFCLAQFIDVFNISALFSAIPSLKEDLGISNVESTWIISAYQLTFASFMLLSGRISDVYNPKYSFVTGISLVGILSTGTGFVHAKIALIILRAISGLAAALTIPSALTLLVHTFPEPAEQARAIGIFGGTGAIANVLGLVIGGVIVEYASWRWVFWFVAIAALSTAGASALLIPAQKPHELGGGKRANPFKTLDMVGVAILTVAIILFIFAMTSGAAQGWATARVLVPLIVSVFLVGGFLYYETLIPASSAAVPPHTWFLKNFAVLFGLSLFPFFWFSSVFTITIPLWQQVYNWSILSSAIHMLPIGITAFFIAGAGTLWRKIETKWLLLSGLVSVLGATVLLTFGNGADHYWPFLFPAFILGSGGAMLVYMQTNIALFQNTPAEMAGTVGAIFNGALQLGSAVGLAAAGSIESSIEQRQGPDGFEGYTGRRAAFWFLFGIVALEFVAVAVFYRPGRPAVVDEEEVAESEKKGSDIESAMPGEAI